MSPSPAPPALAAVMAPTMRRSAVVKLCLQPTDHAALEVFAKQANTRPATLAAAIVRAGLERLLTEQAEGILHQQQEAA